MKQEQTSKREHKGYDLKKKGQKPTVTESILTGCHWQQPHKINRRVYNNRTKLIAANIWKLQKTLVKYLLKWKNCIIQSQTCIFAQSNGSPFSWPLENRLVQLVSAAKCTTTKSKHRQADETQKKKICTIRFLCKIIKVNFTRGKLDLPWGKLELPRGKLTEGKKTRSVFGK